MSETDSLMKTISKKSPKDQQKALEAHLDKLFSAKNFKELEAYIDVLFREDLPAGLTSPLLSKFAEGLEKLSSGEIIKISPNALAKIATRLLGLEAQVYIYIYIYIWVCRIWLLGIN